jgi:hypothetical protein
MNRLGVCVIGAIALFGCSGIELSTQKNPNADLARLRTFDWQRPRPGGSPNSIIDSQIEQSLQADLARIGLQPVRKGESPDFLISYNTSVLSIVTQGGGAAVGFGTTLNRHVGVGVTAPLATQVRTQERGSLAVSFVDPQKNEEIWHATATASIDRSNRDIRTIQTAVQKMVREFESSRGTA